MNHDLLAYIKMLSLRDEKTLSQKALKAGEEFGELAKVALPYDNAYATTHRFAIADKILEECVDLTLCALSVAYDLGFTDDDIESMMYAKANKWASLQDKSQVEYPLPYEIHVTVSTPAPHVVFDVDQFKIACAEIGVKAVVLDLQNRGGKCVMHDYMTSSKHYGNNRSAYEEAMRIQRLLVAKGFDVTRVKVETVPWHPMAPRTINEEMPGCSHFESHIPVHILEIDIPLLNNICTELGLHLSQNVFKRLPSGMVVIMTTYRSRSHTSTTFQDKIDYIQQELQRAGFTIGKSVVEFCVYDTKNGHDTKWLASN